MQRLQTYGAPLRWLYRLVRHWQTQGPGLQKEAVAASDGIQNRSFKASKEAIPGLFIGLFVQREM